VSLFNGAKPRLRRPAATRPLGQTTALVLAAFGLAALASVSVGCGCDGASLEDAARELGTADAEQCGWVPKDTTNPHDTDAYRCAVTAFNEARPFVLFVPLMVLEGEASSAWVRAPDGNVSTLTYDSEPCVGCTGQLWIRDCKAPKIADDADGVPALACAEISARRSVCK